MIRKYLAWFVSLGLAMGLLGLVTGGSRADYAPAPISAGVGNSLDLAASSPLSGSYKTASATALTRGDSLTYTLVLSNSGLVDVTASFTDIMPAETNGGTLFFSSDISGTVNTFPPGGGTALFPGQIILPAGNWGWTGVISANRQVVLQLRVNLKTGYTQPVTFTNRLDISDGLGNTFTRQSQPVSYYPPHYALYLPVVLKSYSPPPPPTPVPTPAPVNPPAGYCAPYALGDIPVGDDPRGGRPGH